MPIPLIVWGLGALGTAIISGCSGGNDNTGDGGVLKILDDTWQPKPDAGGVDNDSHNETDAAYDNPDAGVPPPDTNTPNPDTQPTGPVDNDGDNFYLCGADEFAKLQNGQKVNCDCDDNNRSINPEAVQGLGGKDTDCDGSNQVDITHAAKFVGESANDKVGSQNIDLGDVNHDGYADVIIAAPTHTTGVGTEGKVGIFFGGPNKFKPGQTYNLADADVTLIGGGGWAFASSLAAVPVGTDNNGDGKIDNSDFCDLIISAGAYNSGAGNGLVGDGSGNPAEGTTAVLYVKGRLANQWQKKYAFYDLPNSNDEHIVDAYSAANLTQNKMGILKDSQAAGFNISYGEDFDGDGKKDVMLGQTNSAQIHLIPLQAYLGMHWLQDIRTTWIQDFSWDSVINELGHHKIEDVSGDGKPDLILSHPVNSNNNLGDNGRVTIIEGGSNKSAINISADDGSVTDGNNTPVPYMTLIGANANDLVGTGLAVADLDGIPGADIAIGASNQSGSNQQSGCIPVLFAENFTPQFNGMNIQLNNDLPNYGGIVIDGDANNSYITEGGTLQSFNPNGQEYNKIIFGAPSHPNGSRFYVSDLVDALGMNQFLISTNQFASVVGPSGFAKWFSKGADVAGSKGESILVGSPLEVNNRGAAYLFFGIGE